MPKEIKFCLPKGTYWFLSPLASFPIKMDVDGKMYEFSTVEHYYQAMKFEASDERFQTIIGLKNADDARLLTKTAAYKINRRKDFDKHKFEIMERALRAKFAQNPEAAELLKQTGDALLIKCCPVCYQCGFGIGSGENRMGKILMAIRKEISDFLEKRMQNIIKTKRLCLIPLEISDVDSFVEIAKHMRYKKKQNPDYFLYWRFDYGEAKTDNDLPNAVMKLLTSAQNKAPKETTLRLKIALQNGQIIGYIGFSHNPTDAYGSDLGIFLDPEYEHQGFAFEAQKSLLSYYFVTCDDKIYCTIFPQNAPSHHLNKKCGAVQVGYQEKSKYGQERNVLMITRHDFIKKVFEKEFSEAEQEKIFLRDFLNECNDVEGF